ncbi:DUF2325 domain-containing protein [Anthocerotibacter panamensis]|uniref:DUF2325 domain-containing protein n=1 Tax=Anthocerotibacter panamensis TaxID=2857077 RepID=UPI001C403ED6|nr:DUF2325 domain-containing protein [Anthocerotibacter panamensis]
MSDPVQVLIQDSCQAISTAQQALALQQEYEFQIRLHCETIRAELNPVYEAMRQALTDCSCLGAEHPAYQALKTQWEQVSALYEHPETLAQERYEMQQSALFVADEDALRQEDCAIAEEIKCYDQDLIQDILQTIEQTEPYLNTADLAIELDYHKRTLRANGVFEQVVNALLDRLNALDRTDKPPKQVQGSHEATLEWMVRFAWSQRHAGTISPVPLRKSNRKRDRQPYEYTDLSGRVVVFGGHRQMEVKIRSFLGEKVKLIWFSPDEVSATTVADRAEVIQGANVAVVVTPYLSHKFQGIIKDTCKRYGITLDYYNQTGYKALLEFIAEKLATTQTVAGAEKPVETPESAEAKLNALAQMYSRRGR